MNLVSILQMLKDTHHDFTARELVRCDKELIAEYRSSSVRRGCGLCRLTEDVDQAGRDA